MTCSITVHGKPRSRGSKRAITRHGKTILLDSDKHSRAWVDAIRAMAGEAWKAELLRGPVRVDVVFFFARPKCHFGTGRNAAILKASAPTMHVQKPDVDKSLRGVLDGLTGVIFKDDSQVVTAIASKAWTLAGERTDIMIASLEGESC